ncbi:hypothetical protein GCM10010466_31170 [Planomonospora alba]|uniref:Thiolase C-terminal domain-containing protein n=1 Tax=Planomonospora alba TaxID=161354 RepID=A0ABP6N8Q4_9ACTN
MSTGAVYVLGAVRTPFGRYGGALAPGRPPGASGARITGTVAHRPAAAGSGTGPASLCIGVGQGLAVILER